MPRFVPFIGLLAVALWAAWAWELQAPSAERAPPDRGAARADHDRGSSPQPVIAAGSPVPQPVSVSAASAESAAVRQPEPARETDGTDEFSGADDPESDAIRRHEEEVQAAEGAYANVNRELALRRLDREWKNGAENSAATDALRRELEQRFSGFGAPTGWDVACKGALCRADFRTQDMELASRIEAASQLEDRHTIVVPEGDPEQGTISALHIYFVAERDAPGVLGHNVDGVFSPGRPGPSAPATALAAESP